jgi:glycosyltransferase involved in cell wall biosynthesis
MSRNPQVTWLLPVLNGTPYLPETLASIESQTLQDFEVLAWDNGSTDGTLDVLHDWIPKRLPGRVISGRPMGLGACLAELVEMASTTYCARIDADDVNHPNRLELQLEFLARNPDVVVVGTQARSIDANGQVLLQQQQLPTAHEKIVLRLLRRWSLWHPTVLFRRDAAIQAGNYFPERPVEDYSLWLRMAQVGRLANLAETLLDRRVHDESVVAMAKEEGDLGQTTVECIVHYGADLYGLSDATLNDVARGSRLSLADQVAVWSSLRRYPGARPASLASEILSSESWPLLKATVARTIRS